MDPPPLPRTLILDYYDSYTNNLLTLFTSLYSDQEVLEKVVVVKSDYYNWQEFRQEVVPNVDCIILSPGPGRSDNLPDIGFALNLIRLHPVPILGVCLGHQAIATAYGGKIINTPQITHGHVISVTTLPIGLFASQQWINATSDSGEIEVVVYNSLTIDPTCLPDELQVTAWSTEDSGQGTIQGIRHRTHPIWGVQYHPESISSSQGSALLHSFLANVNSHHSSPASYPDLKPALLKACSYRSNAATSTVSWSSSTTPSLQHPYLQSPHPSSPKSELRLGLYEHKFGTIGRGLRTEDVSRGYMRSRKGKERASGEIWLDGETRTRPSTTSIAFPSFIITYNLATRTIQLHHTANTPQKLQLRPGETFWDWFGEAQKSLSASLSTSTFTSFSPQHTPQEDQGQEAEGGSNGIEDDAAVDGGEGGFKGGWVGYFGYEMKAESLAGYSKGRYGVVQDDGGIERALNAERIDACWCWCDSVLERSKEGEWILRGILQAAGHADAAKLADSTSVDSDTLEETDTLPLAGNPLHTSEYPSPSNVDCRSPSRTNGHSNTSHMTSSSTDDNNSESSHPITATKRTQSSSTISLLQWLRDLNILPFITSAAYETLQQTLSLILSSPPSPRPSPSSPIPTFTPTCSPKSYKSLVETCRSAIHEGESYELTLTTSFESPLPDKVDPLDLYCGLRQRNPAYYSCFMHLNIDKQGEKGMYVLSSSPERFLKIDNTLSVCDSTVRKEANATNDRCQGQMMPGRRKGKRVVEMMPIKGTKRRVGYGECVCRVGRGCGGVRRHINYDASVNESHEAEGILRACEAEGRIEDWRRGEELRLDVKERAENLMIVDLIRSDLLSCCTPSTVVVPKLIALESYAVHHLVTTVRGELAPGIGSIEAVKRCFPPGSMTGAPKLRSVQLLEKFESNRPRGVYSGALGYISIDGNVDLSVVIRTIVVKGDKMTLGAGGAITWLSDADKEWEEVLTKVGSVVGDIGRL